MESTKVANMIHVSEINIQYFKAQIDFQFHMFVITRPASMARVRVSNCTEEVVEPTFSNCYITGQRAKAFDLGSKLGSGKSCVCIC